MIIIMIIIIMMILMIIITMIKIMIIIHIYSSSKWRDLVRDLIGNLPKYVMSSLLFLNILHVLNYAV